MNFSFVTTSLGQSKQCWLCKGSNDTPYPSPAKIYRGSPALLLKSWITINNSFSCLKMSENCQKSAKTAEGTIFSLAFFAPEILNERDGSFRTYDLAKTALFALFGIFRTWGRSAPISTI